MEANQNLLSYFSLTLKELQLIYNKSNDAKLGFSVLYKYLKNNGSFPKHKEDVPDEIVEFIARQLKVNKETYSSYDFNSRMAYLHKKQIRQELGFREYSKSDANSLKEWFLKVALPIDDSVEYLKEQAYKKFFSIKVEPTTDEGLMRIINSALNTYENDIYESIYKKLPTETIQKFESFLVAETNSNRSEQTIWFQDFNDDPNGANISSVSTESSKLRFIEEMNIPKGICDEIPPRYLKKYYKRSKSENISELRRHPRMYQIRFINYIFSL